MSSLFLEAESFRSPGGWVIDPAAMGQMGSAYLMAHGAGVPVADAETEFRLPEAGSHRVWVRTRDWTAVWKRGTPAGRFTLRIDGKELPEVLGTNGPRWGWQCAGEVFLPAGGHTVALHDLTGFNGRCDALYLTDVPGDVPPDGGEALEAFRREKCQVVPTDDPEFYDLVVAGGGIAGTVIMQAMRWGVARGVFSNEAGLGSAPIAAAAARTDHPSRQGYINMTGTFFDTLIVCTITGLVIASSGMLGTVDAAGNPVTGVALTISAFSTVLGSLGGFVVTIGIALFAFSTILGWEYYGEKALEYLVKSPVVCRCYRLIFCLISYVGATTALQVVWDFSDVVNGLMAIPNLICLLVLSREVAGECFDYQKKYLKKKRG